MDNSGIACITGYGLELALRDEPPSQLIPTHVRWMAPEVLSTESKPITSLDGCKRADVYSFAMVMFEVSQPKYSHTSISPFLKVLSGMVPFPSDSAEGVAKRVAIGDRPEWPSNNPSQALVGALWDQVKSCWSQEPTERPTALDVQQALMEVHAQKPALMREWERIDSAIEDRTFVGQIVATRGLIFCWFAAHFAHEERKEYCNSNKESDATLVPTTTEKVGCDEPPPLPPVPTICFTRDEIVTRLLDHLDDLTSITLSGAVGIGKTTVALSILHHDRVKAKFGDSRHFMRFDGDLENSLETFLERLSNAIGFLPTKNMQQLRSRLACSPPLLLVLDGVECVLDPLAVESEDIALAIEEISQYQNVSLLVTSRMDVNIPGFQTIEVATIPGDEARDLFYSLCPLDRSSVIDDLIASLDFHPLSVVLLARAARERGWDEPMLLHEWDSYRTGMLKLDNNQSLAAAIESALTAPTVRKLGPAAQETLKAIAAFPGGVEETRVERMFPLIDGVGTVVNVLYRFYLVERHGRFVRMLSPFRFHFMQQTPITVYVREDAGNDDDPVAEEEEHIRCNCARGGPSQMFIVRQPD